MHVTYNVPTNVAVFPSTLNLLAQNAAPIVFSYSPRNVPGLYNIIYNCSSPPYSNLMILIDGCNKAGNLNAGF